MTSVRLKTHVHLVTNADPPGPLPYISLDDVASGEGRLVRGRTLVERSPEPTGMVAVKSGDVLFGKLRPYLRKWFAVDRPLLASSEFLALRPKVGLRPRWLGYLVATQRFTDWAVATSDGAKMPRTSWRDLSEFGFDLVSEMNQEAIADFLDAETARIDALARGKERMKALLGQRINAGVEAWHTALIECTGSVSLRRIAERVEQGWSPVCDSEEATAEEWGVLKTSSVSAGTFRASDSKRLPAETSPDLRWQIRDGDLLVTRGSGSRDMVGRCAVAATEGRRLLLSDLLYRVRLRTSRPTFVAACLATPAIRAAIEVAIRSDAGQTLKVRVDDLKELRIPATPASEQAREEAVLREALGPIERGIEMLNRQIELLRERRQALITAAMTGQMEIPGTT